MLDRMYKEYPTGSAPAPMEALAEKIRTADAFVFVTGEYNWGVQPGLKNLTDHFLEEWFWRPAAIASYSGGRLAGARSNSTWHGILSEMGMVVISSTLTVAQIGQTLDEANDSQGRQARRLRAHSRDLRTISPGGPKPPRRNAPAKPRLDPDLLSPALLSPAGLTGNRAGLVRKRIEPVHEPPVDPVLEPPDPCARERESPLRADRVGVASRDKVHGVGLRPEGLQLGSRQQSSGYCRRGRVRPARRRRLIWAAHAA